MTMPAGPTSKSASSVVIDDPVRFHQELAPQWENKYRKASFAFRQQILAECLTDVPLNTSTWLDAGCGTGTLARWLAEQGCIVEAVDAAPEMLRAARDVILPTSQLATITYRHVTSIEALPFTANSFDGILCSSVLEYVPDPSATIHELGRVLRPGGVLVISVPSARSILRALLRMIHWCTSVIGRPWPKYLSVSKHQHSVREFKDLLQAHALVTEKWLCFGTSAARWFPNNQIVGSLLMFRARKKRTA